MSLFIGIDSGTQSVKAVVLDLDTRRVIAEARAPHALIDGLPVGHMEQHPKDWTDALDQVLSEVAGKIDRSRVQGIGVSGQQHGFVPLDENGAVIRPAKLWCDTSTTAECAIITKKLGGPKSAIKKTGNLILPGFTAPKILWLKRREPANYKRLRHVLLPHDYLNYHLTGNYFMEHGDASGTALMDVRKRTWSKEAIHAIDKNLVDWLPPISGSHEAAGTLRPELATKFGFSPNVVISAGGGDNMMGAIGTGNVSPGKFTMSLGTSGTLYAYSDAPVVDPQGNIAAFCSSTGGWLPLLCTMNCTLATELVRAPLAVGIDELDATIAAAPPGADGLVVLPFFTGERTPDLPKAKACFIGLTPTTSSKAHMLRATVEGATFALKFGVDELAALGLSAEEIVLTGGGANSQVWRAIVADVCNLPVTVLEQQEGAAFGAALQALWALERSETPALAIEDITAVHLSRDRAACTMPDAARAAVYAHRYTAYQRALRQVAPLFGAV